jgi:hypothetical protein
MKPGASTALEEIVTRNNPVPGIAYESELKIASKRRLAKNLSVLGDGAMAACCGTE